MPSLKGSANTNIYTNIDELRRLKYLAKGFSFLPQQPVNSLLSGKNSSKLRGRGLNFEELRHYRPGDDIRSMDWKTTRRTGKPHIKVYTEERERNVYLIVDQRSSMFFGSIAKMKSVIATEVAALIAWKIAGTGDRVGAVVYNDKTTHVVPAKRGQSHVVNVLTELIKQNQQLKSGNKLNDSSTTLNQVLKKLHQVCGHNSLVVFISDGHGWDTQSTDLVKKVRQHNEVIMCHVYDPLEQTLPKMSHMIVNDGDQQIQLSSMSPDIRKKYQDDVTLQLSRYDDFAKKYRIPLIPISTIVPVELQLRKALGRVVK